jgi:hypothetical protein
MKRRSRAARSITYNYVTENIILQGQAGPHLL